MPTMQLFQAKNTMVGCGENSTGGNKLLKGKLRRNSTIRQKSTKLLQRVCAVFATSTNCKTYCNGKRNPCKRKEQSICLPCSFFIFKILGAWWQKLNFEATSTNKFPNQRVARNDAFVFQRGKVLQVLDEPVCNDELWRCWWNFFQRR